MIIYNKPMFNFGSLIMTRGVSEEIETNIIFSQEIDAAFNKYIVCDWGDMCEGDKHLNNAAVKNGDDRILASYKTSKGKIYIITEWNRSATTILFANEY